MKYENLLALRYIKAQKRQSLFTSVSIAVAVSVITMVFILYSVCINCIRNTYYSRGPYHLIFTELTEEQGEALADFEEVRSVKLNNTQDGVTAHVLFGGDIGDRELWLQNAAKKIGASEQYERSKNNSMHGAYVWNDNLMNIDGIYDGAHLFKLRIFCIFFIFAILIAFALRLIIDTAFEVSSKERERHYGVLQSIGATPEQIVRIITYEGLRLCIVGVPFGLLAGIGLAYLMYHVLLSAGISELFLGMTNAKLELPFSVDWRMLLISAAVGIVWVFLSAYGVGMRIIKKSPMEAIITRSDKVEKVRKRTLSGLLFGISGSIASRNARRQKKRFVITVLTLTVSITMFALFSTLTETVEDSMSAYLTVTSSIESGGADFAAEIGNRIIGVSYKEAGQELADSGLFKNIGFEVTEIYALDTGKKGGLVRYLNREAYERIWGDSAPVSYDELVRTGGYLLNQESSKMQDTSDAVRQDKLTFFLQHRTIPEGLSIRENSLKEMLDACKYDDRQAHEVSVLGTVSREYDDAVLFGALETYEAIADSWFGEPIFAVVASFNFNGNGIYNAADHNKAADWFKEHSDKVMMQANNYGDKCAIHNLIASVRAGVLILNLLIALAALINLLNIISTGIANRRSELASMQCVGMTDRQLDRMAIIECLQFTGAAALISAFVCAFIIFSLEIALSLIINASLVGTESEETIKMLHDLIRLDRITPFIRIILASLTAFAAGCVTSFIMLRIQNTESLSDQIRGSEMKLDEKKSHILRNSVIAVVGAFVLVIGGLRIFSVVSYHNDRKEYEKAGYLNLVKSNGFKMNVYSTGAENGKHTIVGLAGMGCHAFPIQSEPMNALIGKENTLVYADHAGYGFSGDSVKKQTIPQVVEDLRTGLKNAGFEAPYVLMGHSYGDFYALYWEEQYPDEVEAVIMLDGSIPPKSEIWQYYSIDEYPSESAAYAYANRRVLRTWLGLDRLFPQEDDGGQVPEAAATLTAEQLRLVELCNHRECSAAFASEIMLDKQGFAQMGETLHPTGTPKLYIATDYSCEDDIRTFYELQKADFEAAGREAKINPETAAKAEWQRDGAYYRNIYENVLPAFAEKVGNCRVETVAGDHGCFFAQQPQKVADLILDFLAETEE